MISLLSDDWRTTSPTLHDTHAHPSESRTALTNEVGEPATSAELPRLSDAHLQAWIDHCGRQLLAANDKLQVEREPYFALRGDVAHWERLQREALLERGRRPHIVARMERERGLA